MFVGRNEELARLEKLYKKDDFQMVVIYGRRRVGKTTLTTEFAKNKRALYFTALEQSDQNNLSDFTAKIQEFFGVPRMSGSFESWAAAFDYLAQKAEEEPFVFIFDEFPYAAQRNEALPSTLQIAIDHKAQEYGNAHDPLRKQSGIHGKQGLGKEKPVIRQTHRPDEDFAARFPSSAQDASRVRHARDVSLLRMLRRRPLLPFPDRHDSEFQREPREPLFRSNGLPLRGADGPFTARTV